MTCPVCFGVDTCEVSWCTTTVGAKPAAMISAAAAGECADCAEWYGVHNHMCPRFPKHGNRTCRECSWYNGLHSVGCQSRGYAAVGQHPDSPDRCPDTPRAPAAGTKCECGVDKTGVGGVDKTGVGGMHSSWCAKAT